MSTDSKYPSKYSGHSSPCTDSKTEKRPTVGKLSQELAQKVPDTRDPIELEREMHKNYEYNIMQALEQAKKAYCYVNTFFIVVETKKEKLMPNVLRNYFFTRLSCPTPTYDQTVYQYTHKDEKIEFLWTIPSRDTCQLLKDNALQVAPEERALLDFVLDFYDGTLLQKAKQLNNEIET